MYLEIFLVDFAVFRNFWGISWNFAGPRPREISEAPSSCHGNTGYTQKIMYFKEVNKSVALIILFLSTSLDEKQSINITYVIGSCSS